MSICHNDFILLQSAHKMDTGSGLATSTSNPEDPESERFSLSQQGSDSGSQTDGSSVSDEPQTKKAKYAAKAKAKPGVIRLESVNMAIAQHVSSWTCNFGPDPEVSKSITNLLGVHQIQLDIKEGSPQASAAAHHTRSGGLTGNSPEDSCNVNFLHYLKEMSNINHQHGDEYLKKLGLIQKLCGTDGKGIFCFDMKKIIYGEAAPDIPDSGIEYDDFYDDKDDEKIGPPLNRPKGNPSVRGYWEGNGLTEYNPLSEIFHSKNDNEDKEIEEESTALASIPENETERRVAQQERRKRVGRIKQEVKETVNIAEEAMKKGEITEEM